MFDIGWSELLLIGVVALIVVGPQDLPKLFRSLGRMTAKARGMAREFSKAMEDAARDSGINEAAGSLRDIKSMTSKKNLGLDALDRAVDKFEKWDPAMPRPRAGNGTGAASPAATPDPASPTPAPAAAAAPAATPSAVVAKADLPAPTPDAEPAPSGQRRLRAVRRSDLNEG